MIAWHTWEIVSNFKGKKNNRKYDYRLIRFFGVFYNYFLGRGGGEQVHVQSVKDSRPYGKDAYQNIPDLRSQTAVCRTRNLPIRYLYKYVQTHIYILYNIYHFLYMHIIYSNVNISNIIRLLMVFFKKYFSA